MTERLQSKRHVKAALDMDALKVVRTMRKCSRQCPAFILCPLMPLSVKPKEAAKRICLVNMGDDRLKVAYYKMFVGDSDGVIQMLQTNLLEYGELLKESEKIPLRDRLRALEKFNSMLGQLHKMMEAGKKANGAGNSEDDEMDEVVLIASGNDPKPDPESLEHSPMLDALIQHEPQKKPEVDLGKELLDKFFPQEE